MCVIMLVDKVRPTDQMIDKAWEKNDDGGGIAWRETKDGVTEVLWKKGVEDKEELRDLIKAIPMPFVVHFRTASCGGIRPSLTHPFPIAKKSSLALNGRTKDHVLFHNGDWKSWAETARAAAVASNTPVPVGKWSDSRAIAWLCSIYGIGFMEFLPEQKGVAFGPNDMEIFTGVSGWKKIDVGNSFIWCSNDYFMPYVAPAHHGFNKPYYCKFGTCTEKETDNFGYCPKHTSGVLQKLGEPGGAHKEPPFVLPKGEVISLEVAEKLHKEKDQTGKKLLSKNLLKKIRKIYQDMSGKGRRADTAKVELALLSQSLTTGGPVH